MKYREIALELGYELKDHVEMFCFLITNDEQFEDFKTNYLHVSPIRNIVQDLCAFRMAAIQQANVTEHQFAVDFQSDPITALEGLIQMPVNLDRKELENYSPEFIYSNFLDKPNSNAKGLLKEPVRVEEDVELLF